jgi:hypothetical protein
MMSSSPLSPHAVHVQSPKAEMTNQVGGLALALGEPALLGLGQLGETQWVR